MNTLLAICAVVSAVTGIFGLYYARRGPVPPRPSDVAWARAAMQTVRSYWPVLIAACASVSLLISSWVMYEWPHAAPAPIIKTVTKLVTVKVATPDPAQIRQVLDLQKTVAADGVEISRLTHLLRQKVHTATTATAPPDLPKIGNDNTTYGLYPPPSSMGSGNTFVGPTDSQGHTIIRGGTSVGAGACAGDPTSVAIGAGAGPNRCGNRNDTPH
jgi:hypothetical protein